MENRDDFDNKSKNIKNRKTLKPLREHTCNLKEKNGITMVALVVTIVVLLILSTITIQGITHTGLFSSAENAKLEHKRAYIATTLETKLKISQSEQIRGTDEEIIKATYEDVKNDLDEIKKAGGKDIEVGEVTSEEREGKTEWFFEVKVDGDVYKVALDGSDYLGKENELSPLIQIKTVKSTTNTISVSVTTKRNEGGKVEYYIKEKAASKFTLAKTTDQNEYTYTGLKQDTTFVIKAIAIGKNGKEKESKEVEIETSTVPKFDSKEIEFAVEPNTWTNKSVKVTAKPKVDTQGFTLVTSKNPTSSWTKVNNQTFSTNGTMYVALTDGNNYGVTASHEVTNIDKIKPVITGVTATTNTIKITATDEASGICAYAISESSTMPTKFTVVDSTKIFNKIIENKKQSTKYYVWVKDQAGNVSEVASTTTGTVAGLTDANTTFSKTPNDWTNKDVTVTAATTEKNFALQTKKDNGEWQTTGTQTFTENGTIYARLWDGINAGAETKLNVTTIDKLAPNAFTPKATVTTNSIKVDGTTTDATATSTNGSSGIKEYRFSKDGGKTYTNAQTSATYTFGGLTQNVEYTIVVEAKDNAGNTTIGTVKATTGTVPTASGATYTPNTWTKGNVTVTLPTKSGYTTVYTTNGTAPTKDSTKYSAAFTVSSNCKINYLYTDGTNIGGAGTVNVTNIDTANPVINTAITGSGTTSTIKLSMAVSDTQSGVNKIIWYYKLSTDSTYKNATDTYTATTANTTRTHTFTGLTQNKTYNAYAVVYDATGRTTQSTTINVTTGTVPTASGATYTPNTWTSGKVTVTLPTKSGYTTVYTTNGKTPTKDSTKYSEAFTVGNNCTIYYLFTDGINIGGAGTVNIGNIDKTAPTINSVTENSNTSTASTATISTSDNGRIVSYGISTSATTQPTNWIATNKVDLTNVPVKVENGATWARVFYHNNVEGSVLFANEAEALSTNSRYKFSVLNNLENYRNSSGTFEFMLQYPNDTTQYNRWIQKDNPAKVTVANGTGNETASGYKAVHVDWTGNYWGGLTRSTATSACLINGSVGHGNWFYAIGAYSRYDKGIPSYSATATATELWARIDNLSTEGKISLNVTLGNITTNGTYYAWVKDAAGNVTSKQFTISKVDKTAPTISNLTSSNTNWTSGNITLTATASDTESGLYTASPYGWNSTTTWTNSNTLNVTKNGTYTVNVRNAIGSINSKSIVISNIDKTGPTINTALTGSGTTNSITLNTAISDAQSGVNKIIWYYKLSTDSTYKNATDTYTATTANTTRTHTFTGLTQNKTYNAYAVVYDATGRTTQSTTINVTTGTVPTASGATYTPTTWTSGKVTVTLPTKSGYTTVYTTNGTAPTKSSTKYTGAFAVSSNCKINYLFTDGTNIGGVGTVNVTNIDTANPVINTAITGSGTTSTIKLSMAVSDTQSGVNKIIWYYKLSTDSTYKNATDTYTATTANTTRTHTFTGLTQNKTYNAYAVVYDATGRTTQSTTINVTTGTVPTASGATYTPNTWTSGKVTVTLPTKSGYTTVYTTNGTAPTKDSTKYSAAFTVSSNCKINYLYTDGTNIGGAGTVNVTNIDTANPVINTAITGSGTTSTIKLSMAVSDTQSGVNKIIWYYKLSTDSTYKNATDTYTATTANTTRTHTFTGLTQNKTYNAYAVVYDATGRTTQSTTINVTTGTVPTASGATYTPSTWTNGNVSVTLPTKSGYSTLYTTNGTIPTLSSNQYTSAITAGSNSTIYYVFSDGINIGGTGAVNINNIDKIKPEINISNNETSSSAILEIKAADNVGVKSIVTSGGKNTITNAQNISSKELEYNLELTDDGETKITVTDIAGNTVEKNYKLKFLFKQNDERTAVTGGWKENMFLNIYGYIYNVGYTKNNGLLTITAEPTSVDQGRLGTWYTNNSIDFTGYDTIRSATWFNKNSTGSVELRVGYNSVAQDNINTIKKDDANGGYWSKLTANILGKDKSQVAIGTNGGKSDFVQIYLACMYIFGLK